MRRLVQEHRIDAIVNCAAFTNVDAAESEPEQAERLNAQAPENLALAMKEVGGLLVHISTDYVFGGEPEDTPLREDHPCAPTSVYGRTKLHGEEAIRRMGCRHVIIRTAWLYSEYGKNFVKTMLRLSAERPQIKVVSDQIGTPTYAGDLAAAVLTILSTVAVPAGTYHFSNEGSCSWYEFACEIVRQAQDGRACEILPCRSDEYPSPVRRPAYSVLDKTLIRETFGLRIPHWTESLRRCLSVLLA